jgi:hypothetical protein
MLFVSTELGDAIASLAALLTSSVPVMPVCEKTHRNPISFLVCDIIFWMVYMI